jgi:hypothetical protein
MGDVARLSGDVERATSPTRPTSTCCATSATTVHRIHPVQSRRHGPGPRRVGVGADCCYQAAIRRLNDRRHRRVPRGVRGIEQACGETLGAVHSPPMRFDGAPAQPGPSDEQPTPNASRRCAVVGPANFDQAGRWASVSTACCPPAAAHLAKKAWVGTRSAPNWNRDVRQLLCELHYRTRPARPDLPRDRSQSRHRHGHQHRARCGRWARRDALPR